MLAKLESFSSEKFSKSETLAEGKVKERLAAKSLQKAFLPAHIFYKLMAAHLSIVMETIIERSFLENLCFMTRKRGFSIPRTATRSNVIRLSYFPQHLAHIPRN